jgi:hypothetical protein
MGRPSPKTPIVGRVGIPSDGSPPLVSLLARCREARDREEARLERDCKRDLGTGEIEGDRDGM